MKRVMEECQKHSAAMNDEWYSDVMAFRRELAQNLEDRQCQYRECHEILFADLADHANGRHRLHQERPPHGQMSPGEVFEMPGEVPPLRLQGSPAEIHKMPGDITQHPMPE